LREAFAHPGPAVIETVVDANEPGLPGHISTQQAVKFAEAIVRGEKDRGPIIANVVKDMLKDVLPAKLREVI